MVLGLEETNVETLSLANLYRFDRKLQFTKYLSDPRPLALIICSRSNIYMVHGVRKLAVQAVNCLIYYYIT